MGCLNVQSPRHQPAATTTYGLSARRSNGIDRTGGAIASLVAGPLFNFQVAVRAGLPLLALATTSSMAATRWAINRSSNPRRSSLGDDLSMSSVCREW